ncbi:MAG: hypothetical protein QG615_1020 [Nitrospirota bacterium]|nr:hypothetical protein [Nitrospirota bacterium]
MPSSSVTSSRNDKPFNFKSGTHSPQTRISTRYSPLPVWRNHNGHWGRCCSAVADAGKDSSGFPTMTRLSWENNWALFLWRDFSRRASWDRSADVIFSTVIRRASPSFLNRTDQTHKARIIDYRQRMQVTPPDLQTGQGHLYEHSLLADDLRYRGILIPDHRETNHGTE